MICDTNRPDPICVGVSPCQEYLSAGIYMGESEQTAHVSVFFNGVEMVANIEVVPSEEIMVPISLFNENGVHVIVVTSDSGETILYQSIKTHPITS